jgi:hypothetical protein
MKYIKSFLDILNEGAYINPENPDEVILTFTNLPDKHPQFDNEVLVTVVDLKEKKVSDYVLDKYFALVLPNEDINVGLGSMKLKKLDHSGRPKATMDLLKAGKIRGGQAAVDDFLNNAIPKIGLRNIDYVCSLDSTGPLVKMMTNFFIYNYGSTQVDLPKFKYSTILDAIIWDKLATELAASEKNTKEDYHEDSKKYLDQNKYIIDLARKNISFTLPYKIKVGPKKEIIIKKKFEKPDGSPKAIIKDIIEKQESTLNKFFSVIEESVDVLGTPKSAYDKFKSERSKTIKKIIDVYHIGNEQTIGDPRADIIDPDSISATIIDIVKFYLKDLSFQPDYKLRTSGTALGSSMRKIFKDKYQYTISFEEAVFDCVGTNKKMIIIDDNIHSGTDFRNIDRRVQEIINSNTRFKNLPNVYSNIKMFVLYDMGSKIEMKKGNTYVERLTTKKEIIQDFKNSILNLKGRIPQVIIMSYNLFPNKKTPSPSLPTLKLKIGALGEIEDIELDVAKSSLSYASEYPDNVDPTNWNFPFNIGDTIFDSDANLKPEFKAWAKSIGIFVNGEKFE